MDQLSALMIPLVTVAGILLLAVGVALLRVSWRGTRPRNLPFLLGGWLLVVGGFYAFVEAWGVEVGVAYAFMALGLAAYAIIVYGRELRQARAPREREVALEPEERPTNWPRAVSKALLSIVLAGIASIGLGVAFAVAMPMPTHDRLMIGGLLVPILWGGGMAWTLSDAKLLRATLLLVGVSLLGYGIAFLPKVMAKVLA